MCINRYRENKNRLSLKMIRKFLDCLKHVAPLKTNILALLLIQNIFLQQLWNGVLCLHMMALEVPQFVISGEETTLTCVFDLEQDTLYSIKWYRDDLEFFRYVPSDKPPNKFFPLQGLNIDLGRSSNGTVYIQDVDVSTAGNYKCEISADEPSFQTVSAEKMLTVIDWQQNLSDPHDRSKSPAETDLLTHD
ncbi:ig-like domain-containing protein [Trichonephila clavata]|uniref:Ig-like domain-containing protein n=1 Tax=Trichonephila clavata TaxID=2740835 RepID=A0A8X6GMY6_TRICU|nr:ig-like domain-containing protein [Trichonephila clavata]